MPLEVLERRVRSLHAQGLSQARIAAELGVSRHVVRSAAATLGLSWDRAATAAATAAASADARRDRVALLVRFIDLANDSLDVAENPAASAEERHAAVIHAGIAADKAAVLSRGIGDFETEASEEAARADLRNLIDAIHASAGEHSEEVARAE